MADNVVYIPDSTSRLELEWVVRQFWRISDALGGSGVSGGGTGGRTYQTTELSSTDSPYTTRNRDEVILADTTSGAITVTLQAGQDKRYLYIKNVGTALNVTVTPNGSDDIDKTGASWTLSPMQSIHIIYSSADANWYVI